MNPEDRDQDLDRLLAELVDGELSPVERLHLMALLRDDPAARDRYVEYLCLDSLLAWELSLAGKGTRGREEALDEPAGRREATGASAAPGRPRGRAPAPRGWRGRAGWAAAAAALLVGLLVGLGRWRGDGPKPASTEVTRTGPAVEPAGEPQAGGLAILTRAVDVRWDDAEPALGVGTVLSQGVLRFRSGVVQIEFYSGAMLVLEGPAEVELKAVDRIACRYGKLRALVPPRAHGFRVDSASVELVDLGTEFGMRVAADHRAEVHVFDGKVEVRHPAPGPDQEAWRELSEGDGLRIGQGGDMTPLAADSPGFLTPMDLDGLYRQESERRYREWTNHSRALLGDPRLVAYVSFESDRRPGSRALDYQGEGRARHGTIIGCEWVDGRWPGKGALEFKRPADRVGIDVPGEFESLTFAAWVRIDAIEHRFNGLMLTDGFDDPGESHWQIDHIGRLVLGVRNARPIGPKDDWRLGQKNYTSPPVITPETFGRWIHLATVYDHRARSVTHYLDGAAIWSEPLAWDIRLQIGEAALGNWARVPGYNPVPIRNLCGRMDEFALFRAALSAQEIRELYRWGTGSVR